jgi:hypothetical protein
MAVAMTRLLLTLALIAAPAAAAPPATEAGDARIPFPNRGGIVRMQAEREEVIYVQDRHHDWYRAELYGPCLGLARSLRIGFDTRGSNDFDRFSTIVVGDERCQIRSMAPSAPPPSKRRRSGR